jgi:DsbC/DsbD-like thiol-disulfide interchange protein
VKRVLYFLLIVTCFVSMKTIGAQIPAAKDIVASSAFTSYEPVARGKEFQIAVVLKIRDGYHINARKTTLDYLIPTDLKVDAPAGFKTGEVTYPEGTLKSFAFSKDEKLNVYTGTVILHLTVTPSADAALGAQHIPLKLRYQACSESVCLPPVRQDVDASFTVAVNAKSAHDDLFMKK